MDIRKAFPGKFIKAGDIAGIPKIITIKSIAMEAIGDDNESKPVIRWEGSDQGFVLNQTNSNTIADAFSHDTNEWIGKDIELYSCKVQFGSKMVDAIRVRLPGTEDMDV